MDIVILECLQRSALLNIKKRTSNLQFSGDSLELFQNLNRYSKPTIIWLCFFSAF